MKFNLNRTNGYKSNILDLDIEKLYEFFDNTRDEYDKYKKMIYQDIPDGELIKPSPSLTRSNILKLYKDVNHIEEIIEEIPI